MCKMRLYSSHSHSKCLHTKHPLGTVSFSGDTMNKIRTTPYRDVQTFGVSGPHRKKKSCLGPHIKYTNPTEN